MMFERPTLFLLCFALAVSVLTVSIGANAEPRMTVRGAERQQQAQTRATSPEIFDEGVAAYDAGDYQQAFELWLPLAKGRDLAAMRNVAHMLRLGLGVPRNPARALYFYEQAGEGGLGNAQLNAAFMHISNDGVRRNEEAAANWFEKAARQGSATAQYNLGVMLERGMGRVKNEKQALAYYMLAAAEGHAMAIERVNQLAKSPENAPPPELEMPD